MVLADSNKANISKAKDLDLEAISVNIYSDDLSSNVELSDVTWILAPGSQEVNQQAINRLSKDFGETGTYRLMSPEEKLLDNQADNATLFSHTHDYNMLEEVSEPIHPFKEIPVNSKSQLMKLLSIIEEDDDTVSLFLKLPMDI